MKLGKTLGEVFDPRNNALNAWRLILATGVIFGHAFPLTGRTMTFGPPAKLIDEGWVDGFFALSGFLITASWLNNPRLRSYFAARALRLLPGLAVCLAITAFVIVPVGVTIQGGSVSKLFSTPAPFSYVLNNLLLPGVQFGIAGTPQGIPKSGMWNGSIWTLIWEWMCYIVIAIFGVIGLVRRRWFLPTLLVLAYVWLVAAGPMVDDDSAIVTPGQIAARFAVMFFAGAVIYQFRNAIPTRWSLVALAAILVLASPFLPDYHWLGAIPLAYALIVSGALVKNPRLNLRTDLSYGTYIYAFPIQQLLVIIAVATIGLRNLNPIVFAVVSAIATLPLAAFSWFAVEKHALSLKRRLKRKRIPRHRKGTKPEPADVARTG